MTTKTELTPLMQQYYAIKEQHKDAILFFRLGDFYEMFFDDAKKAAPVLEIALTKRHQTPMCGIPFHSANNYIAKLLKKGFRVAICEQVEGSNTGDKKNLFTRKVVHTITPGTLIEENLLNAKINNYIASVLITPHPSITHTLSVGFSFADISTGEFKTTEFFDTVLLPKLVSRFSLYNPKEIIMPEKLRTLKGIESLQNNKNICINFVSDKLFSNQSTDVQQQPRHVLNGMPAHYSAARSSSAALINYIEHTRPNAVEGLKNIECIDDDRVLLMDDTAIKNLELVENLSTRAIEGSLLHVLDNTITAMGARTIRQWILHPLLDIHAVKKRQNAVAYFLENSFLRKDLREKLKSFCDLERTLNRLISGTANARDINAIKNSLSAFNDICSIVPSCPGVNHISAPVEPVAIISSALVDAPPLTVKEGGMFKEGYNVNLDEYRHAISHGKDWIAELEKCEKERTGITNLKISFTSVFGYFIEVTKSHLSKIPADYHRRQTLTNAERFITPALKEMEDKILGAETKAQQLEMKLFQELRIQLLSYSNNIQQCAETTALLDTFASLAETAARNDYTRPEVREEWGIHITDGRHPVVELAVRSKGGFIPNDARMDADSHLWIITGPNMSGKSTFLRQTALIVIMAQIGSFVPAKQAHIGIIDKIFTRIGAADNLMSGESTFMVEMREMAFILQNLTFRSLLILDEVGRGTSTFDGISIAWSVVEYLHKINLHKPQKPLVLFATHYFELTEMPDTMPGIKNYKTDVKEWQGKIVFLHKIAEGSADRSYGLHVADLAGLPKNIIMRSKKMLEKLEINARRNAPAVSEQNMPEEQLSFFNVSPSADHPIIDELNDITINHLTPIHALQKIADWKERFQKS